MSLIQVVYVSQLNTGVDFQSIRKIAYRGAISNRIKNLTGALFCWMPHVLQIIEGDPIRVGQLLEKIKTDPRHDHVEVILQQPIKKRLYWQWNFEVTEERAVNPSDLMRMEKLINKLRQIHNPGNVSTEASWLINEFRSQYFHAA